MTRKKKSRKPSIDPILRLSKEEKKQIAELKEKKPKKQTGKKPGNRQQEAIKKSKSNNQSDQSRDPRIGSKKPIKLMPVNNATKNTTNAKPTKSSPLAAIRVVNSDNNTLNIEQQIKQIENDPLLQDILAKQEQNIALSEHEVEHYNTLMEQHQVLSAELKASEKEVNDFSVDNLEDDELWNKLDQSYFSEDE